MSCSENDSEEFKQIYNTIDQLISQAKHNDQHYSNLEHRFRYLAIGIHEMTNFDQQYVEYRGTYNPEQQQRILHSKQQGETRLQNFLNEFKALRIAFIEKFDLLIKTAEYVLNEIISKHLSNWRENQILVGNGFQPIDPEVLNKIQNWCENLVQILWEMRKQLKSVPMYVEQLNNEDERLPNLLNEFSTKVDKLIHILMKQTIIVEAQPPQVLKTNTKYIKDIYFLSKF